MSLLALRLDWPGVRLGWALGASLVLHLFVLAPVGWWASVPPPPQPAPLRVQLPKPELAPALALTTVVDEEAVEPVPITAAPAVPPAPTFSVQKPKPLRGKALATAMAALSQEEFYPREAIKLGLEGKVILLLHLDSAGQVQAAEVASSSGHALLDAAAVQAAGRISAITGNARQVLLPVDFRLD
ncbi:MAG: energy transducer TonB [Rhodocyclaceae bacterium]|nr:energy transducer TonB [Rhodocyclaceae bacterium]MDZ4214037.1 energy transducer TonB [Rhodocyclaceae bacterium]